MTGWQDEQNDELTAQPAVDSTGPDAVEATMTDERAMASEGL